MKPLIIIHTIVLTLLICSQTLIAQSKLRVMRVDIHGLSEEEEAMTLHVLRQDAPDWGKSKNLREYLATWPLEVSLDADIFFDTTPHPAAQQSMLSYLEDLRQREDVDWRFVGEGIALESKENRAVSTIKIYDVTYLTGKPDQRLGSKDGRYVPESRPIMSLITSMIDADDWECNGGDNGIHSYSDGQHCLLVISAWPRTHLVIQEFLESLEQMRGSSSTKLVNSRSSKARSRKQPYPSKGSSFSKIHR